MDLRVFTPGGAFNWLIIVILALVGLTTVLFMYAGWI
ncbi:GlyGly-CTERM sorting domain-containing protein [Haloarchaeobius sp. DYHT-AS-18]